MAHIYSRTSSGWSDERRARHSAAIRTWAPWKNATGPRTAKGKSISRCNALKHGASSRPAKDFMRNFQAYRKFLQHCWQKRLALSEQIASTLPALSDRPAKAASRPNRSSSRHLAGHIVKPKNELLNTRRQHASQHAIFPSTTTFFIPSTTLPTSPNQILCKQFAFSFTFTYIAPHDSPP